MEAGHGPRLIIVCGLPGSGKTTLAKVLEAQLRAVRFCADEWMDALAMDLYNEEMRGKIEALQWKLGRDLLVLGHIVIVGWGTWGRSERDALRLGRGHWALRWSCTTRVRLWSCCGREFSGEGCRIRRLSGSRWIGGWSRFRCRLERRWSCLISR
jgi:hypothetical protein